MYFLLDEPTLFLDVIKCSHILHIPCYIQYPPYYLPFALFAE